MDLGQVALDRAVRLAERVWSAGTKSSQAQYWMDPAVL
jgi:hypothetical protein